MHRFARHESDAVLPVAVVKAVDGGWFFFNAFGLSKRRQQIDVGKRIAIAGAWQFDFKDAPLLDWLCGERSGFSLRCGDGC